MKKILKIFLSIFLILFVIFLLDLNIKKYKNIEINLLEKNDEKEIIKNNSDVYRVINSSMNIVADFKIEDSVYNNTKHKAVKKDNIEDNLLINENVNKDDNIEDYYIKDVNLVTLEINEDTVTSENATLIITDNNVVAYNFEYYFEIERKKDGGWKEVERLTDRSSLLLGYNRNENNQYIFNTNWKNEYGTLESGTYRIVKYSEGIKFCSNEFEIK